MQLCKHRMHVGTGALAGQSPSREARCSTPAVPGGGMGGDGGRRWWSRCRWPVNAAANQRAATNPTPSLALPVAIQLDSTAQAIPATTLRITCALSWAVLAQFVHGEGRG